MSKYSNAKELASLTLGQKTEYASQYDPSLLQPVPRSLNRQDLELGDQLPFHGGDMWTLYELSWLNDKGLPQVAVGDVFIPATSDNLVESKSFKLYLNSFNQSRFSSWQDVERHLIQDLSACAGETVKVALHPVSHFEHQPIMAMSGECIDEQDISIDSYQFDPQHLAGATEANIVSETLHSHLLKSNCLITNQPDWGSLEIRYQGPKIKREHLLRYIVSFREHNEFHEQCVERIFTDISRYCQPQSLSVLARYTRRGGLDINPYRSSEPCAITNHQRMARQ